MPLSRRPSLARGGRDGGARSAMAGSSAAPGPALSPSSSAAAAAGPPSSAPSGLARFFSTRRSRAAAAAVAAGPSAGPSAHGRSASVHAEPSSSHYDAIPVQHITRATDYAAAASTAPLPRPSHKGSRSVPLIELPLRSPPGPSSAASAAASPASLGATSPAHASSPRHPHHARSRTSSLAGRLGALFVGSDEPAPVAAHEPATATPRSDSHATATPWSDSHASDAPASHASVRSQSSTGVAALSQRVRRMSLGRRAHTSSGSAPPFSGSSQVPQPTPATAPLRQSARMGGPARKLSLRLRNGRGPSPPRTPEIEAWKPHRRVDNEQGQEIAVLARSPESELRVQAAPAMPAWRRPPPPRFLDTPDLAGPMDPKALLHEAGILSDQSSTRTSLESKSRAQSRRSTAARTAEHHGAATGEPNAGVPSRTELLDATGLADGLGLGIEHGLDVQQPHAARVVESGAALGSPRLAPVDLALQLPDANTSYLSVPLDSPLDLTRRPYSLISTDDGVDTPIIGLRRLVVSTTEGAADEELFFRPPTARSASPCLEKKSSTDVLEPPLPFDAEQFREQWEKRSSQIDRSSSPPMSPRDSVVAPSLHSKRASTAASKRFSAHGSEAGATDVSALGAEVSHARRMAAVPMGTARVAEWTRRTRRNSNPTLGDGSQATAQLSRSLSLSKACPPLPAQLTQEALAEAARLGKAPSKRIRRSKSSPMDSNLNVLWGSAAAVPPLLPLAGIPSQAHAPKSPKRRLARLPAATPSPARTLRPSRSGNLQAAAAADDADAAAPDVDASHTAALSSVRTSPHARTRPSYATSEEAALARRREQAEREKRRAERERQREEKRLAAYASKKLNDPLLATRLALVGLAEGDGEVRSPTRKQSGEEPRADTKAPSKDWALREEPFRGVSISSGPYTSRAVQLALAPPARRVSDVAAAAAAPRTLSPAPSSVPPLDSRSSFYTAASGVSDEEDEASTVLGLDPLRSTSAAAPPSAVDDRTSLATTPEGLAALEWPVPPSRSQHAQTSDDGTLLARPGLRISGGTELNAWPGAASPPSVASRASPQMLSLAGITRPISGRLVASPERGAPRLVAAPHHLLASPALRSERASVASMTSAPGTPVLRDG